MQHFFSKKCIRGQGWWGERFITNLTDHDITLGAKGAVKINITCSY